MRPVFRRSDYKLEDIVYELNVAGAALARAACDEYTAQNPAKPRLRRGRDGTDIAHSVHLAGRERSGLARNVTFR